MANSSIVGLLKAVLTADTAQFEKGMRDATADVQRLANTMERDLAGSQKRVNSLVREFLGTKEIGRAHDYAKALEQIGKEQGALGGIARLTAADQGKVNRAVTEALAHYKALGEAAPQNLLAIANATKQVDMPTEKLGGNFDALLGKAKMLAGVFGVSLGAGALVNIAKSAFNAADQIGDLALKMGVSAEAAQRFQYAARQSGAEIEDVSRAIVKMNDNLAEGNKGTIQALTAAGLRFEDIRAMKPEQAFRAIADAIGRIPDPLRQTQVAIELFGKSGPELLAMIREGSLKAADGIRVMSDETIKRLKDAEQAWQNFGNAITIISGEFLAAIMAMAQAAGNLKPGTPGVSVSGSSFGAAKAGGWDSEPIQAQTAKAMADAIASMPGVTGVWEVWRNQSKAIRSAADALSAFDLAYGTLTAQQQTNTATLKAAEDAAKRYRERIEELERGILGLTKANRELLVAETNLVKRGHSGAVLATKMVEFSVTSFTKNLTNHAGAVKATGQYYVDLARSIQGARAAAAGLIDTLVNKTSNKALLLHSGGMSAADIFKQGAGSVPGLPFGEVFSTALGKVPQAILAALTGGGNVGRSIGGLLGGDILQGLTGTIKDGVFVSGLGKTLQNTLGKTLGGAIASIIPGLGTLLGSLLGKLFDLGRNTTRETRDQFAEQLGFGSLDALYKQLQQMGAAGQRLADVGLNVIGKKDKAANEKWMKDVQAFLETVPKKFGELRNAVQAFGGVVPAALRPMVESLLSSANLTAEMRAELEGFAKKPSWKVIQERAEALGIALSGLGPEFSQARLSDIALGYVRDLGLFEDSAVNMNTVLEGMADELSALVTEARKTGSALPKTLEPYLKRLSEMGLLLDENGERIDLGALSFKDIEDEALKQVVSVLEQIRDLLAGKLPQAARQFSDSLTGLWHELPRMPQLNGGLEFGAGGFGASIDTTGGGTIVINAMDVQSFEGWLRSGANRAVLRTLPDAVRKAALSQ